MNLRYSQLTIRTYDGFNHLDVRFRKYNQKALWSASFESLEELKQGLYADLFYIEEKSDEQLKIIAELDEVFTQIGKSIAYLKSQPSKRVKSEIIKYAPYISSLYLKHYSKPSQNATMR